MQALNEIMQSNWLRNQELISDLLLFKVCLQTDYLSMVLQVIVYKSQ